MVINRIMCTLKTLTDLCRSENSAYKFIKAILKEHEHCKKVMKKHFSKNLIITEEEGEKFQISNTCV